MAQHYQIHDNMSDDTGGRRCASAHDVYLLTSVIGSRYDLSTSPYTAELIYGNDDEHVVRIAPCPGDWTCEYR